MALYILEHPRGKKIQASSSRFDSSAAAVAAAAAAAAAAVTAAATATGSREYPCSYFNCGRTQKGTQEARIPLPPRPLSPQASLIDDAPIGHTTSYKLPRTHALRALRKIRKRLFSIPSLSCRPSLTSSGNGQTAHTYVPKYI